MGAKRRRPPGKRRRYAVRFFGMWNRRWGRMPFIRLVGWWLFYLPLICLGTLYCICLLPAALTEGADGTEAIGLLAAFFIGGGLAAWGGIHAFRCTRVCYVLRKHDHVDDLDDSIADQHEGTTVAARGDQTE